MQDGTGITTYSYDPLDRPGNVVNQASRSISYSYDAVSQRKSLLDPDGERGRRQRCQRLSGRACPIIAVHQPVRVPYRG
jgi:YD repeat-containing protein